ncbi:MAG: 30S ribosome-binding factor RbfA [Xanthomonadaceae bacterium]|nr:30S ribosome-binding factor RbfA [Xanthomonadaceae bacterium]
MNSNRLKRLASVIQEELSVFILRELRDPRVSSVTITKVDVTQDAKQATVFIAVLGDPAMDTEKREEMTKTCIEGLASGAGVMRSHLASSLEIRHIPQLLFKQDKGLENTIRVHELLKQIKNEPKSE